MNDNRNESSSIIRPGQNGAGAALERVGFGTSEVHHQRETQGTAVAARAQAEVQARYIVALQRPRNVENVRVRLLQHCGRTGFAQVAEYAKPVGGKSIRGPSIRFVETALQEYGNVLCSASVMWDDDEKRIIGVTVTDLERNVPYYDEAIVEKFVERRNPKDGDEVIGSRKNTYGDTVYRVRATEDDFANKAAAAVSKKTRNLGLRILPADIVDEAMWVCSETRKKADGQDPAAARRMVVDRFAELGVMPTGIEDYLGHPIDQCSPAELDELRAAYATVKDGEAKWIDCVDVARARRGEVEKPTKAGEVAADKIRARIDDIRTKRAAQPAQPPAQQAQGQAPAPAKPDPEAKPDKKPGGKEAGAKKAGPAVTEKTATKEVDPREKEPGWMDAKAKEPAPQHICPKCNKVPCAPPGICEACASS